MKQISPGKYLTPSDDHWACDIEADDLLENATRIYCVCVENVITGEKHAFRERSEFLDWLSGRGACILVGHNFISYDLVMLNRHWGARIPVSRVVDTFVLSQLYNPSMPGGHSLADWGNRLKHPKTEHNDFSVFSEEMLTYCQNDVALTKRLFIRLAARMLSMGFSERGCEIEHLAWNIIQNKQKKNGFPFKEKEAHELYLTLRAREEELKDEIYRLWPPQLLVVGRYTRPFKKDGTPSANYRRHCQQYPRVLLTEDGYEAYDYVAFNLGSPSQRIEKLLELGWTPSQFTPKGNPKVDEDSLLDFAEVSGKPEVSALAKWIVINSRANMLFSVNKKGEETGWLTAVNKKTGYIHGSLFIASTLRYRHNTPNTANIPAVRLKKRDDGSEYVLYGEEGGYSYECRDLWHSGGDDWGLVGIDGTGIQNRCLIHHLILTVGEEAVADFKQLSLEGDIHRRNIEVLGLANKAAAKKFYYTLMMGGGGKRLAADQAQFGTKMTPKEGEVKKKMLVDTIPGFGELIKKLERELERTGRIKLSDGTPILVPSPHMVVPYLLQGDESRLMKQAMIYVDQEVRKAGLADHVLKVADIHDEWQYRVRREYVRRFIDLALPCFPRSGDSFGYRIRIDGDAKVGKTWAETH